MRMSILSDRSANSGNQIKLGGKIRPGIKVLTREASSNPKARDIYNRGVEARLKFSEIEKEIRDKTGIAPSMYPRNTAFFNVASSDFGMPEIAGLIIDTYGEIREEHSALKQLYRFPVVFHSDDLSDIYPNQLKRYGGEPGYESHYGEDGQRYCRYLPEVTAEQLAEQRSRRHKRAPRREHVLRGKCDPGSCNEFLQGQCRFRGRLHFYIPGIPSTGLLGMETTSEYAAENIWSDLERIHQALGGIPRSNPNKPGAPIFWITKVLEQRTYFDERGKKQIGYQWVPKLQADIDIGSLLTKGVVPQLAMSSTPVAWLAAPKGMPNAQMLGASGAELMSGEPNVAGRQATTQGQSPLSVDQSLSPSDQLERLIDEMGLEHDEVGRYLDLKLGFEWLNDDEQVSRGVAILRDLSRVGASCAVLLIRLSVKSSDWGISHEDFVGYACKKYGKGFTSKQQVLETILVELDDLDAIAPTAVRDEVMSVLREPVPA